MVKERTRWIFAGILALLAAQRLAEMRLSRRNERRLLARGGRESAPGQIRVMVVQHAAWFAAMLAETFVLGRPFLPPLAAAAGLLLLAGQALRYAAIRTLGERWTVRVITLPGAPPVERGIYRRIRHPNYLGVGLEILSVPLLHNAWLTAGVFSLVNALVLWRRIAAEERALAEANAYDRHFASRPRFIPVVAQFTTKERRGTKVHEGERKLSGVGFVQPAEPAAQNQPIIK